MSGAFVFDNYSPNNKMTQRMSLPFSLIQFFTPSREGKISYLIDGRKLLESLNSLFNSLYIHITLSVVHEKFNAKYRH